MSEHPFPVVMAVVLLVVLIGIYLSYYIVSEPPDECFLRVAVMGEGDRVSDISCSDFWDAFDIERGVTANYCAQEAQKVVGASFVVYDCWQTCCITDGGCPGCVATHACFCKATFGGVGK